MGVRKYRSVEDMPEATPLPPLDPENIRIACGLSSLAGLRGPLQRPPGVRKYRSWDDLLAARDADEATTATANRR